MKKRPEKPLFCFEMDYFVATFIIRVRTAEGPMKSSITKMMRSTAAVGIILASVGLSACGGGTPTTQPTTSTPIGTLTGGALIYSNTCASCHGVNRTGTTLAPDISVNSPRISGKTENALVVWISTHSPVPLSSAERNLLATFLKTP
jgi:mono/diheme cytochrome c family protein